MARKKWNGSEILDVLKEFLLPASTCTSIDNKKRRQLKMGTDGVRRSIIKSYGSLKCVKSCFGRYLENVIEIPVLIY